LPTKTFAATAFAFIGAGSRPVFADIREDLTVDPADVADRIGADTRAVLTVHIGGLVSPATLDLEHLCRDRGVPLVEDAAHAHGSALNGRPAGTFGIAGAFSFFSTKVITTGEGGMVVTDDARVKETVRLLRDQAKVDGSNLHERTGYNWRPTEIQSIIGLAQLGRLDDFIARRREIAALYDRGLEDVAGARPLPVPRDATHSFYKYVVILEQGDPEVLKEEMKRDFDISLGGYVYDVPLHQQPAFKEYATDPLPRAEDLCRRHVCPPIYPSLTNDEVEYVIDALRRKLTASAQRKEPA
jgi:perosamine synthetase